MSLKLPDPSLLQERRVMLGDLGLHLRVWGDVSKPLVLLLHGGKDHGRSWDWTVAALVDEYCLAVPDLRGHGESDWPSGGGYDSFDFVCDLARIVETLVADGFKAPIHLVGHSLGGNIALHYTAAQPSRVRSLLCIEGLGFSQKSYDQLTNKPPEERVREAVERRLKIAERRPRSFETAEDGIQRLAKLHANLTEDQAEHLARHALRETPAGWQWKHDPQLGFVAVRPLPPSEYGALFSSIQVPVLLMYGTDSWASSPKDDGRIDIFRSASIIEYSDAGHWLHHDRFDDFIKDVRNFLEKHA